MNSVCLSMLDELVEAKKNGLYSTLDKFTLKYNNLIGRCISTIFEEYIHFPTLNKYFVFDDHNIACSPFEIIKELKNLSILYFLNDHLTDIMERNKGYGFYFKFESEDDVTYKTFKCLQPFIINTDNKIKLIKLPKYYNYHYLMILQKKYCNMSNISHGFLLSENTIFDKVLIENLAEEFNLKYNDIEKEFENYKCLFLENEYRLKPFFMRGFLKEDYYLLLNFHHYYDIDFENFKKNVKNIIDKLFDILEENLINFDYTLYITTTDVLREKFHNMNKPTREVLYIEDDLKSQICSCIFMSNNLPEGHKWFTKNKNVSLNIDNLLGLSKKYQNILHKELDNYFDKIKVLYTSQ